MGETFWTEKWKLSFWNTFSILERIDVGETCQKLATQGSASILSVSSNGSTWVKQLWHASDREQHWPFSILERIDVGETSRAAAPAVPDETFSILERIDVGETAAGMISAAIAMSFQYPRTDRRG